SIPFDIDLPAALTIICHSSNSSEPVQRNPAVAAVQKREKELIMFIHSRRYFPQTCVLLFLSITAIAQQGYRKPPQEVLDILNAPVTPIALVSPARDKILLITGFRYPPLSDLAQPMLRLAGLRINPSSNGPHRAPYFVALSLKQISSGAETKLDLPPGAKISAP